MEIQIQCFGRQYTVFLLRLFKAGQKIWFELSGGKIK